jgi:hypothetical protein
MKINDLIFKELVNRGFKTEGSSKIYNIADSKLWYLTSQQAQGFLYLEQGKEYKKSIFDQEIFLLEKNLSLIAKNFSSPFNIVDLGCGDGGTQAHSNATDRHDGSSSPLTGWKLPRSRRPSEFGKSVGRKDG